jgi:hypothetical protein
MERIIGKVKVIDAFITTPFFYDGSVPLVHKRPRSNTGICDFLSRSRRAVPIIVGWAHTTSRYCFPWCSHDRVRCSFDISFPLVSGNVSQVILLGALHVLIGIHTARSTEATCMRPGALV